MDSAADRAEMIQLLRKWTELFMPNLTTASAVRQVGAIPYTIIEGQPVFLIVTSRGTGRWIFPKGTLPKDRAPWDIAAKEAREEAGVEGTTEREPIGSYRSVKRSGLLVGTVIEVELYPLHVERQLDDWPEKGQRHRHWVILSEARRLLAEPELRNVTKALAQRLNARISQQTHS